MTREGRLSLCVQVNGGRHSLGRPSLLSVAFSLPVPVSSSAPSRLLLPLSLSLSLCLALVCPRESWGVFFCRFFTQFPPLQISTQLVKCITVSCRKRTSHTLRHEQSSLHSTDSNTCLLHTATHCPPAASRAQLLASLLEQTASESQSAREESSGKLSQPEAGQFAARQRVESGSRFGAAKNRGPKLGRRSKQNNRRRRRAKLDGL